MALKRLEEELVVPGIGVAALLNVVVGGVDLGAGELHTILDEGKKREIPSEIIDERKIISIQTKGCMSRFCPGAPYKCIHSLEWITVSMGSSLPTENF